MPVTATRGLPLPATAGPSFATSISPNGRYLLDQYNNPFLIVGTSEQTWTNISVANMQTVMATRASQGFTCELAEIITGAYEDSTGTPAWATYDGVVPFYESDGVTLGTGPSTYDVTQPYIPFWTRIDSLFAAAQSNGLTLFVNLLSTAAYQDNTGFFAAQGTTKLAAFATWFATRYQSYPYHHYWGDDHFTVITGGWAGVDPYITAMMNAAKAVNPRCFHTIENNDGIWTDTGSGYGSGTPDRNLTTDDTSWSVGSGAGQMNLNWMYDSRNNSPDTSRAYNLATPSPVFFGEGLYDNAPSGKNTWSNLLNREYLYFPMINGACGSFYGQQQIALFSTGWQTYLPADTAVTHVGVWKTFMTSLNWWTLVPDTTAAFVTSGNTYSAGTTGTNAAVSSAGHLGMVYLAANGSVTVAMTKMAGTATARWFDPTSGTYSLVGTFPASGSHTFTTTTNNAADDPDWVLVLTA